MNASVEAGAMVLTFNQGVATVWAKIVKIVSITKELVSQVAPASMLRSFLQVSGHSLSAVAPTNLQEANLAVG